MLKVHGKAPAVVVAREYYLEVILVPFDDDDVLYKTGQFGSSEVASFTVIV